MFPDTHAIGVVFETVFSARSVQRSYKEENWGNQVSSVRESEEKRQCSVDSLRREDN
jgi:hypothetical protein